MLIISSTTARCVFNRLTDEDKNLVFTYTSSEALRPDTVTTNAYSLINTSTGQRAEIKNILYEISTKTVTLYVNNDTVHTPYAYALSSAENLLNISGNAVLCNETLYPIYSIYADEGGIEAVSMQYEKDGVPIYNLNGVTDFTVNAVAANTSGIDYENIPYTVYSDKYKTHVIASGTLSFNSDGLAVFNFSVSDYTMSTADEITVDFTV